MQEHNESSIKTRENDITEISDLLKGLRIQFNKCFAKLDQIYDVDLKDDNENKGPKEENENEIKESEANLSTLVLPQFDEKNNSKKDTEESDKDDGSNSKNDKQTKDIEENVHTNDKIQLESNLDDVNENLVKVDETAEIKNDCDKDVSQTPKQKIPVKHGYQPSPAHEDPDWQLKYPILIELIPSSGIYINKKDFEHCENLSENVPCFIEHLVTAIFKPANRKNSNWDLRYANVTELIPQSNIFVSKNMFDNLKTFTDNWKKLVEDIMEAIFTDEALAVCSRTGRKSNRYSYNEALESPRLNERAYKALVTFVNDFRKKQGLDDLSEIDKIIEKKLKKCKSKNKK